MLTMARQMGCAPKKVVILGVQPDSIQPGLEMTTAVQEALPQVISLALAEAVK
jgi:hydrogenase maturation protease